MSFFCVQGTDYPCWLFFYSLNEQGKWLLSKLQFCKILKRKCSQMENLELLFFPNFIAHLRIFIFSFGDQNWIFYEENKLHFCQKVIKHWFFAISWIERISNYPIYNNLNMSPTNCESFAKISQINALFVVWIRVNWDKIYIGLLCSTAPNWLIFMYGDKSAIIPSSSTLSMCRYVASPNWSQRCLFLTFWDSLWFLTISLPF